MPSSLSFFSTVEHEVPPLPQFLICVAMVITESLGLSRIGTTTSWNGNTMVPGFLRRMVAAMRAETSRQLTLDAELRQFRPMALGGVKS